MNTIWKSTAPQKEFWLKWFKNREWAISFVAGFGSGKSEILHVLAVAIIILFPWANVAVYAPTYDLLNLNNIPRIGELLTAAGLKWKYNKSNFIFTIEGHGQIICRSMDNPGRIIAYEVFASLADELDTMPTSRADEAWNKIISRNRQQPPCGTMLPKDTLILFNDEEYLLTEETEMTKEMEVINKCGVFTTPEGFKFTYKKWEKETNEGYALIRASTYSNPHLPKSYIDNLKNSYPPQLIEAYLEGKFVNLTGGAVYHSFDRRKHSFSFEAFISERVAA